MSSPDISNTLGNLFLSLAVGAVLYGVTLTQAYVYFSRYHDDGRILKFLVVVICVLDGLNLVFTTHLVYHYVITNFGVFEALNHVVWSMKALSVAHESLVPLVELLYLWRIRKLSLLLPKSGATAPKIISGAWVTICVLILANTAFGFRNIIFFDTFLRHDWNVPVGLALWCPIAISTSGGMVFLLRPALHGGKRVGGLVGAVILYSVATGLLTSLVSVVCLVVFIADQNSLLYIAIGLCLPRLYANSCLAMLNARLRLRDRLADATITVDVTRALEFRIPQSEGVTTTQKDVSIMVNSYNANHVDLELGNEGTHSEIRTVLSMTDGHSS
ncbi:hypothetical protein JAAARDRAFT_34011 [Jaapia argillacea MUCL 33604]|uniref:DUF6534 domain-containing protein n=1 Tax=Jaapia argillacea MUCL 33604 TaxID=933084 RepID=A0A067PZG9_9AGAM|nr:hypothetical protein JAAARDRAFT_34011 [Jaapia argillacea MUCL 33604]